MKGALLLAMAAFALAAATATTGCEDEARGPTGARSTVGGPVERVYLGVACPRPNAGSASPSRSAGPPAASPRCSTDAACACARSAPPPTDPARNGRAS